MVQRRWKGINGTNIMATIFFTKQEYNEVSVSKLLNIRTGDWEKSYEVNQRLNVVSEEFYSLAKEKNFSLRKEELALFQKWLFTIHDSKYLNFLKNKSLDLHESDYLFNHSYHPKYVANDTPIVKGSYIQACLAGFTIYQAARFVGLLSKGCMFAFTRPPGHHAGKNFMGGYCYLNNAMIAAKALAEVSDSKIAILDLDYHFGNGTYDLVETSSEFTFVSVHAPTQLTYPYSQFENQENIQLYEFNQPPSEIEYMEKVEEALTFLKKSTILVVSIGYDILGNDPHGNWMLKPKIFEKIGARLKEKFDVLFIVQEGGYNLENIQEGTLQLMKGIAKARGDRK